MTAMVTIATTELKRLFRSPLAWSILGIIQFILALIFFKLVDEFIYTIQPKAAGLDNAPGVTETLVVAVYLWAGMILLAVMPLLTMRSIAEERANKTFVLLRSSPLSTTDIVLGKFLALIGFILILVGMISLMPLSLALGTSLDFGHSLIAALGLFLLLSSFAAAGLFISAISPQPTIAALASFGFLFFLLVLYIAGKSQTEGSELFVYLSHFGHFLSFLKGIFDSADLIYYCLFIIGFLVLTIRKLDNERLG
ncbi:MAG: ABC transporter permease subunit [Thiotrichaceae bacterium]|nr:ABC transporter permease subunit [Thiotrichaceae bacterium]